MKTRKERVILIILCACIVGLGFNRKQRIYPNSYYQVYLNDEILGTISSKEKLEDYIDKKNEQYKKKFNVKKIYAPNGLVFKKIETYNGKISPVEEIYKEINEKGNFTISGYQFNIKNEDKITTVYTLKKSIFETAIENTIKTFLGEDHYNLYQEDNQEEIETTGSIIENVYVEENITVKKTNIPVTEIIYTDSATLSKFLVFGTVEDQKTYTVQIGDTIEDVAFNNEISVGEFLISNPTFTNAKNLLFPGQQVTIGITDPKISVVEEQYVVKDQEVNYQTEYQYDEEKLIGDDEIIQKGENGLERIAQRIKYVNGTIAYVDPVSKEELKPTISEIVIKGEKFVPTVGSTSNWLWPTNSGYTISSDYIYRINPITGGRELHAAVDIAGTGYGSPIYAVTNGVVSEATYRYQDGNYVCINHNNGYYTCYAHMSRRNVVAGQTVARGQIIGFVGQSGWATGPHLHFEVWIGRPWYGGYRINPWTKYR